MKRTMFQRAVCLLLSVTMLLGMFAISTSAATMKSDSTSTLQQMQAFLNASSYDVYIADKKTTAGLDPIEIDITQFESGEQDRTKASLVNAGAACVEYPYWDAFLKDGVTSVDQMAAETVYLPATGSTTWRFNVDPGKAGLYFIKLQYYNCDVEESSISSIERKLYIDEAIPFTEASYITLQKTWRYDNQTTRTLAEYQAEDHAEDKVLKTLRESDREASELVQYIQTPSAYMKRVFHDDMVTDYTISQDINGNSMSPEPIQVSRWQTYYCQDSTGYHEGYFAFYFSEGMHSITLEAVREPFVVGSITLVPTDDVNTSIATYEEFKAANAASGYTAPQNGKVTVIQAEFPDFESDSSVSVTNDNSSSANTPSAPNAQLFNVIGENSYSTVGQWAAYKFRVNESGLYKLGARYLQNALQGMYVCRTIKLAGGEYGLADGTPAAPFVEAYDTQFNFSKEWQSNYLGDSKGNIFEFYFEEGVEYTLYLECSLGSLKQLISRVEKSLNSINDDYLRILQLTGADPDEFRDYGFIDIMPDVLVDLLEQAIELSKIADEFEELCGTKGSHIATLDTVALLLDRMGRDEGYEVAANMANLKSYLGTLGTWINNSKRSSITMDTIVVAPANESEKSLPKAQDGFFASFWFEIKSFIFSFFTQYDAMGLTSIPDENAQKIEVWLATGRDQSSIWRSMIDAKDGFTDSTGVAATLKLVTAGTLLPSILSGKGPDVYLGLGSADVINYAIREAILGVDGDDLRLPQETNRYFTNYYYTYKDGNGHYETTEQPIAGKTPSFVSKPYLETIGYTENADKSITPKSKAEGGPIFAPAAMDTITLLNVSYGLPLTMSFAMMFYRADILANLDQDVPRTWDEVLALLPVLQSNNMSIGLSYISAIDFMLYQMGGNMWKYTDNAEYAGAKIALDTNVAYESFQFVCSLYTDYSFPYTYDGANRFRTGEMPILVGDYAGIYNQLVVYATELNGLWNFCSLPGYYSTDAEKFSHLEEWNEEGGYYYSYDSMAGVGATVMLYGCRDTLAAWQFMQWQTSADVQSTYGNKMVALIGPSAKYESANIKAINNLSWNASERAAIEDQMEHLSSRVNYPGSYIIDRYTKFAFLDAYNNGATAVDALRNYVKPINDEISRKRSEFGLKTLQPGEEPSAIGN